jgi:hypothetical protein
MDWLAEILSQGPEESRMSTWEIGELAADGHENDPKLYQWIMRQAWQMIIDYRTLKKKV